MIREIVVASGKGGTGKTFISSNLAFFLKHHLNKNVVCADADVEAPDLILALGGVREVISEHPFYGTKLPVIDYSVCTKCGSCIRACRFNALHMGETGPVVDYYSCEGLGTCSLVCPVNAISFKDKIIGRIIVARSGTDLLTITGDLEVGESNSGRLVYEIKKEAHDLAASEKADYIVVDAAPGIGCPVISSLSGSDILLIVVEPTPQSLKGAIRLTKVSEDLGIKWYIILNKYNLNLEFSKEILKAFKSRVLEAVPYDFEVIVSYSRMTPLLSLKPSSMTSMALKNAFNKLLKVIK